MGRGRLTGDGKRAASPAGNPFGLPAKWIFLWLSSGCDRRSFDPAAFWMALDVLGRWHPRATCSLHTQQSAGIRSMAATQAAKFWRHPARDAALLETLPVPHRADDPDDVPLP